MILMDSANDLSGWMGDAASGFTISALHTGLVLRESHLRSANHLYHIHCDLSSLQHQQSWMKINRRAHGVKQTTIKRLLATRPSRKSVLVEYLEPHGFPNTAQFLHSAKMAIIDSAQKGMDIVVTILH